MTKKSTVTATTPKPTSEPLVTAKEPKRTAPVSTQPDKLTYLLSAYTAERRKDGWYIAKSVSSFAGERPRWSGPFHSIETACLSIARHLAVEVADRHTRSIEALKLTPGSPLYGLKPTTRLRHKSPKGSVA